MRLVCIISLCLLVACKVQPPNQNVPLVDEELAVLNTVPNWVSAKPGSSVYYSGVGNASLSDPDYQANAKLEALDDLASEISITIESNSLLSQVENSSGFRENYSSSIRSSTQQEIQSYELVDSWSDKRQYWVYYQLEKSEFEKIRNEKREAALSKARASFIHAERMESEDLVQSVKFYAQTIEDLKNYLNKKNEWVRPEGTVLLAKESLASIQKLLRSIRLMASETPFVFEATENTRSLTIKSQSDSGIAVQGLPLIIRSSAGDQEIITDGEGHYNRTIPKNEILNQGLFAEISLGFLDQYPISKSFLKNFPTYQLEVNFIATPPVYSISSSETNLRSPLPKNILEPLFEKILTEKGVNLTGKSDAQFELSINAITRKGTETNGLFSTYLDFTISIIDDSDLSVFSDSFNDIKGLHTSYEKAGLKAYQKVEKELIDEIENTLNKHFSN
ncbi:MAG: LPP20 family lipoprotein [Bacteroidota bacterium]